MGNFLGTIWFIQYCHRGRLQRIQLLLGRSSWLCKRCQLRTRTFQLRYNDHKHGTPYIYSLLHYRESVLDLSLVSSDLMLETNWDVLPDTMGSDYFPIRITIHATPETIPKFRRAKRLYTKQINWEFIRANLDEQISMLPSLTSSPADIQVSYSTFVETIINSLLTSRRNHFLPI